MSEPAAKQRQMINLDEFERRLGRPVSPAKSGEDPLAELARLVGDTEDRFKGAFQARPAAPAPAEPRYNSDRRAPRAGAGNGVASRTARLGGNFAAIEAGLRGSIAPDFHAAPAADFRAAPAAYSEPEDEDWLEAPSVAQTHAYNIEPPRSRLPLYATAAIIILGMAGIGGSFALKRGSLAPHEIATIRAADGPIKIQASDTGDVAKPAQDASILDKSPPPAPLSVVSHSEEPVNLGPAPQPPAQAPVNEMRAASAAPSSAAVVPVPAPPALDTQSQSFGLAGMIEPKKVKTVAVRPDGTIVSGDAPQQQQGLPTISPGVTPPPALNGTAPAQAAAPAPKGAAPTMAESAPPAENSAAASSDVSAEHPPAAYKSEMPRARAKPEKLADADVGATDAASQSASRPHGFAVQLAAPQTEAEARQTMAKLQKKFASELGSYHLKYHLASVADKSVYRVRVVGLSHEEAVTLCQQVQAKGGNCFVAKN